MSQGKIFFLVNITLIGASGFFVYYLLTVVPARPSEITAMNQQLAALTSETLYGGSARPKPPNPEADLIHLKTALNMFGPIYTPTPSPTPSPSPTPQVIAFKEVIDPWVITSIDGESVGIKDQRDNKEFTLRLGEEPFKFNYKGAQTVRLMKIDLAADPFTITLRNQRNESRQLKYQ